MSENLDNKVALVTGAARRIGAAIVRKLHADGARVAVHYRGSAKDADVLVSELNALRAESAAAFQLDLQDCDAMPRLVADIVAWGGSLNILVNNASTFYATPLGDISAKQWDEIVGPNLKAPLFLSQAAIPELRKSRGSIINIVDIHAQRPLRNHSVYGAAKAGLAMLTRSLAKDLSPEIRVNGVSPGAILWPEDDMGDDAKKSIVQQIPLQRCGNPDDIAGCVLYLVKDASYVTGQVIAVDGGRSLGW